MHTRTKTPAQTEYLTPWDGYPCLPSQYLARPSGAINSFKPLTFSPQTPPPPQTLWETGHLMSYTPMRRDTVDKCCGGNTHPQSEAAPQTYSPEHEHEHATAFPPPHCVPAVSIFRCIAFVSSLTILFSRLPIPCMVPTMPLHGMLVLAAWACRCHMSTIWLAAIAF